MSKEVFEGTRLKLNQVRNWKSSHSQSEDVASLSGDPLGLKIPFNNSFRLQKRLSKSWQTWNMCLWFQCCCWQQMIQTKLIRNSFVPFSMVFCRFNDKKIEFLNYSSHWWHFCACMFVHSLVDEWKSVSSTSNEKAPISLIQS